MSTSDQLLLSIRDKLRESKGKITVRHMTFSLERRDALDVIRYASGNTEVIVGIINKRNNACTYTLENPAEIVKNAHCAIIGRGVGRGI